MENDHENWIKTMLSVPMDEPVTAKIMQQPIRELRERLEIVNEKMLQVGPPKDSDFYLLVADKDTREYWYRIPHQNQVTIGRSNTADLNLDHSEISRIHCRIERDGIGLKIVDSNSRNGLVVNNKKIPNKSLCTGDMICLGPSLLIFVDNTGYWKGEQEKKIKFQV